MTLGEKLLNLTVEYRDSQEARASAFAGSSPAGREPSVIAAEYEAAITELLTR